VKYRHALLIVFAIIVLDQLLKFYIKTNFYYGEEVNVMGNWFKLHFIENEGMAFGMKLGEAATGKIILTLFRLCAVVFGFYLLNRLIIRGYGNGVIICGSLILAGALGNLLDSMFYGMIFSESQFPYHFHNMAVYHAKLVPLGHGYGKFLHGRVVDMLYFPIIDTRIAGRDFVFFEPVFNIADASISVGVLVLVIFQKKLIHKKHSSNAKPVTQ
jgi:signal peptidase II